MFAVINVCVFMRQNHVHDHWWCSWWSWWCLRGLIFALSCLVHYLMYLGAWITSVGIYFCDSKMGANLKPSKSCINIKEFTVIIVNHINMSNKFTVLHLQINKQLYKLTWLTMTTVWAKLLCWMTNVEGLLQLLSIWVHYNTTVPECGGHGSLQPASMADSSCLSTSFLDTAGPDIF